MPNDPQTQATSDLEVESELSLEELDAISGGDGTASGTIPVTITLPPQ